MQARRLASLEQVSREQGKDLASIELQENGIFPPAVSLDDQVFGDDLYDCLRQTVNRPIGVKLPAESSLTLEQLGYEFAHSGLTEQARKKLLRGYKMDTQFQLLPRQVTEDQRKQLTAPQREQESRGVQAVHSYAGHRSTVASWHESSVHVFCMCFRPTCGCLCCRGTGAG